MTMTFSDIIIVFTVNSDCIIVYMCTIHNILNLSKIYIVNFHFITARDVKTGLSYKCSHVDVTYRKQQV